MVPIITVTTAVNKMDFNSFVSLMIYIVEKLLVEVLKILYGNGTIIPIFALWLFGCLVERIMEVSALCCDAVNPDPL